MKLIALLAMISLGIYLPIALVQTLLFQATIETLHAASRTASHPVVRR